MHCSWLEAACRNTTFHRHQFEASLILFDIRSLSSFSPPLLISLFRIAPLFFPPLLLFFLWVTTSCTCWRKQPNTHCWHHRESGVQDVLSWLKQQSSKHFNATSYSLGYFMNKPGTKSIGTKRCFHPWSCAKAQVNTPLGNLRTVKFFCDQEYFKNLSEL